MLFDWFSLFIIVTISDRYDENLMGDTEDRARLAGLSEKEREQEIFKRIERRELMKTRYQLSLHLFISVSFTKQNR